jgi:hypothetical protein
MKRALLMVLLTIIGVALARMLAGCESTQILKGRGEATEPPIGYVIECAKNPALENCK